MMSLPPSSILEIKRRSVLNDKIFDTLEIESRRVAR
jgi:hypothetical protein